MATYKSEDINISSPADVVFNKLSNLEGLANMLKNVPEDKIPADKREIFEQIKITSDSIAFPGGPVGDVTLKLTELVNPSLIKLEGVGTPVPLAMMLHIKPVSPLASSASVEVDINIPMMLKPMVSGPLQKMVNQFAQVLAAVPMI